jgi:hypothetical protein
MIDWMISIFRTILESPFSNWVCGAGLGASFYVLTKAQPYLQNRSYDPKYNNTYICRFVIGVVAGVILARIGNVIITGDKSGTMVSNLGPGVIAIIGGYSAEAVQLILQRLADIITTMVRGDSSAEAKARLSAQHNDKIADARMKLANLKAAHLAKDHSAVTDALKDLDTTLK